MSVLKSACKPQCTTPHSTCKDTSCFTLLTRCVRKWLKFGLYLHLKPLKKATPHDYNPLWPSENKLPFLFCREQNDKGGSNIIRLYLASQNMTYCILYSLRPNPEELSTATQELNEMIFFVTIESPTLTQLLTSALTQFNQINVEHQIIICGFAEL